MTQIIDRLFLVERMNLRSIRAIYRIYGRFGRRVYYFPRKDLIERLCNELGWTTEQTIEQLLHERKLIEEEFFRNRGG
jgi:hypothetical protein